MKLRVVPAAPDRAFLVGEMSMETMATFMSWIDAYVKQRGRSNKLVFECENLEAIRSNGVAILLSTFEQFDEEGGSIQLVGLNDTCRAVFKALDLDRHAMLVAEDF